MDAQSAELTCSICLEIFTRPVVLRCAHSLCLACAVTEGRRVLATGATEMRCPQCRAPTPINGASRDTLDLVVSQPLSALADMARARGALCSACEASPITQDCQQCSVGYCDTCLAEVHGRVARFKGHTIVPHAGATAAAARAPVRYCETHKKKELSLYCQQDKVLVCENCLLVGEHRNANNGAPHRCTSIEDAHVAAKAEFTKEYQVAQANLMQLEEASRLSVATHQQLMVNRETTALTITNAFNEAIQALAMRRDDLLATLQYQTAAKDAALLQQQERLRATYVTGSASMVTLCNLLNKSDAAAFLTHLPSSIERLKEIAAVGASLKAPAADSEISFSEGALTRMKQDIPSCGTISYKMSQGMRVITTGMSGTPREKGRGRGNVTRDADDGRSSAAPVRMYAVAGAAAPVAYDRGADLCMFPKSVINPPASSPSSSQWPFQ